MSTRRLVQNSHSIFDEIYSAFPFHEQKHTAYPPYDIIKTDDGYQVRVVLNGANKEDLSVYLQNQQLIIKYDAPAKRDEGINFVHKGISTKSFEIKFNVKLGTSLDIKKASTENGILTVSVGVIENIKKIEIL